MLTIKNLTNYDLPIRELREKLSKVVEEKMLNKKLILYLVNNDEITTLNNKFFKKNNATNVISFPYDEKTFLGEIFISVEYCESEKEESGFELKELVCFYFIHGLLHLLGYEHIYGGIEEKEMEKEQERLFKLIFPEVEFEQ